MALLYIVQVNPNFTLINFFMFCLAQESQFLEVKVKDSWLDLKGLVNHNQRPIKNAASPEGGSSLTDT